MYTYTHCCSYVLIDQLYYLSCEVHPHLGKRGQPNVFIFELWQQ